jgi:hypothetical protein
MTTKTVAMPYTRHAVSLAVVLLSGLATPMHAQPPGPVLQPIKPPAEEYHKIAPAGGGVIVGVVEDGQPQFAGTVQLWMPPRPNARVCVEVSSIDGRYFGRAEYQASGVIGFAKLAPQFAAKLGTLPAGDLAVAATLTDCDHRSNSYVVASWSTAPADHPMVVVLINAEMGTDVSIFTPAEVPCDPIKEKRAVTVTVRCRIGPLKDPMTPLTIRRIRAENQLPDIAIQVYAR